MLTLDKASIFSEGGGEERPLLSRISCSFSRGDFVAVIGPSGCGKSTLLKTIAGIASGREEGMVRWDGRDLAESDFLPSEFGYVPQFGIAPEELTVAECVDYSARLRMRGLSADARRGLVSELLARVGMGEFRDRRVKVLSGGQKRRLALSMEPVSSPPLLLCDEVTSGLDPRSEEEIVRLLRCVATDGPRLVVSVTHSLRHLSLCDRVVVLYRGVLAYDGKPGHLAHYFRVADPELIYGRLEERDPADWEASWQKHSGSFADTTPDGEDRDRMPVDFTTDPELTVVPEEGLPVTIPGENPAGAGTPGFLSQVLTLLERRIRIFTRSSSQLWLQAGLVFGFPVLVAIFGWNGLPQIRNLGMGFDLNVIQQLTEARDFLIQASKVGSLVSGIVMFEVVLLALMGANNSGREIAAERGILEKEKLSGLSPGAYVASKVLFLGLLCAVQSLWMGLFVHLTCAFPGDFSSQLLFLFLVNAAMTSVCLAISSLSGTAEQASLASIYLVGFQLPLSGAVLALPGRIGEIAHPFIAAYWSWSGILESLRGDRYYDIAVMVIQTGLSSAPVCLWMLSLHIVAGIVLAWQGSTSTRIE